MNRGVNFRRVDLKLATTAPSLKRQVLKANASGIINTNMAANVENLVEIGRIQETRTAVPGELYARLCYAFLITDRVSTREILQSPTSVRSSVCLSVSTLTFEPSDL